MKTDFFLLKFLLSSGTFVLNQITAFINMGCDVEIVALQKGDLENTHTSFSTHQLGGKTHQLFNRPGGRLTKLKYRAATTLHSLTRAATWKALNVARYDEGAHNLILTAIYGGNPQALQADVFIAHFRPVGVTAAKLRKLEMIRGKIATVFRGVDVSYRDVPAHCTPEYQQLF